MLIVTTYIIKAFNLQVHPHLPDVLGFLVILDYPERQNIQNLLVKLMYNFKDLKENVFACLEIHKKIVMTLNIK